MATLHASDTVGGGFADVQGEGTFAPDGDGPYGVGIVGPKKLDHETRRIRCIQTDAGGVGAVGGDCRGLGVLAERGRHSSDESVRVSVRCRRNENCRFTLKPTQMTGQGTRPPRDGRVDLKLNCRRAGLRFPFAPCVFWSCRPGRLGETSLDLTRRDP